jgi:hypothetical protein
MPSLISQDEAILTCRNCGTPVPGHLSQCAQCGSRTPYACEECAKPLSALSLGLSPTPRHPYGAYSESGGPLCHEHRLTACHECGELFRFHQTTRREIGTHLDTETREGKTPRVEPVYGYFCAECEQARPEDAGEEPPVVRYAGMAFGAVLVGLGSLLAYLFIFAD